MKYKVKIILIILTVFFLNIGNVNALDNKWSLYFKDNGYEFYYDKKRIYRDEGGVYEVITKAVLLNGCKTVSLYRIDCGTDECAIGRTKFGENDETFRLRLPDSKKWKWSKPEGHLVELVDIVCKNK